jgi:Putative zinc-finger
VILAFRANRRIGITAKPLRVGRQVRHHDPAGTADVKLTCKEEMDLISPYCDAELEVSDLISFENHLAACPDCTAFLNTFKKTLDLTRNFFARQERQPQTVGLSCRSTYRRAKRR